MNVTTFNENNKEMFIGVRKFQGKYSNKVDRRFEPIVRHPRRVPVTLRPQLQETMQPKVVDKFKNTLINKSDNFIMISKKEKFHISM